MTWISVKDRLPQHRVDVLVYCQQKECAVIKPELQEGRIFWQDDAGYSYDVTHWQPLPEPPEIKE
jgi:hypothetical protein